MLSAELSLYVSTHADKYQSIFANPWTWGYLASTLVSTIYCTAWDLLQDYGLFKIWKGKNIFLRKRLIYPKVSST